MINNLHPCTDDRGLNCLELDSSGSRSNSTLNQKFFFKAEVAWGGELGVSATRPPPADTHSETPFSLFSIGRLVPVRASRSSVPRVP